MSESDFGEEQYSYAVGVVKNMSGLREYVKDFMDSQMSADAFIETVISGQFNVIQKDGLIKKNSKPKKSKAVSSLVPDLNRMQTSDNPEPEEGEEMDWGDMEGGTAGYSQGGDGGGVGGESVRHSTNTLEEDDDSQYNFDFLDDIEVDDNG